MTKSKLRVAAQLLAVLVTTVTLAAPVLAQNLTVTLLQKGTSGTLVGVPGVQVARHNPATGAFIESNATDGSGVANFGNIGSTRTTLSIIFPDFAQGPETIKATVALVNVPTGNLKFRIDDEIFEDENSGPVLANFNVALTGIPANASTSMNLAAGKFLEGGPSGQFNGIAVGTRSLDASGKVNIIAEARGLSSVLACGSALALDPATINGTTVPIALNSAPIQIPFTTTPSTAIRVGHNVVFLRNSAVVEGGHGHSGTEIFQTSGNLTHCPVAGFDKVLIKATNGSDEGPAYKEARKSFLALPASVNFVLPDLTINSFSRSASTLHWTTSGTAAADGTFIDLEWASGATQFAWRVLTDPSVTSVTLPTLPGAYADRNGLPTNGVTAGTYHVGFDFVTGFDAFVSALGAVDGSLGRLFFNATDSFLVFRGLKPTVVDFDGDAKSDIGVYRNGLWIYKPSSGGANVATQFGGGTDVPLLGDYDGDGKNDIAVYRNGLWIVLRSSDSAVAATQFGGGSDVPLPADYDGDGKTDIAVYRNGLWIILRSSDSGVTATQFGGGSDVPLPADYDGDGKADIAVYRNGLWIVFRSSDNSVTATWFGGGTDVPLPADYDGDGKADIAVYRNGLWIILKSSDGAVTGTWFGGGTDVPVPADYDGDGKTDIAVYRNGLWIYQPSSGGANVATQFGGGSDLPLN